MRDFVQAELRNYILRKLGGSGTDVELTEEDLDDAIEDALEFYSTQFPNAKFAMVKPATESGKYRIPDHEHYRGILDVWLIGVTQFYGFVSDSGFGFPQPLNSGAFTVIAGKLWEDENAMMWLEEANRTFAANFEWDEKNKDFYFTNCPPDATIVIEYGSSHEEVATVRDSHRRWFREYCVCRAKQVLGEIRSKIQSIPGPGGQGISLNGTDLKNEGSMRQTDLETELYSLRGDEPPIIS